MKKVVVGLSLAVVITLIILIFFVFNQKTVSVGRYEVLYYVNQCDLEPGPFPSDLESLKRLPGLIRIIWQEQIAHDMFQEYCYLPDKGVEKTRIIHKKM